MYGTRGHRWDGIRMFGRPPVLAPPAWALTERTWEGTGLWTGEGTARGDAPAAVDVEMRMIPADSGKDQAQASIQAQAPDQPQDPIQTQVPAQVQEHVQDRVQMQAQLAAEVDRLIAAVPVGARRIVLVVPDGTRVGPWRALLPHVLTALAGAIPRSRRTLLVASGVHAVLSAETLARHLLPNDPEPSKTLEAWAVTQNGDNQFQGHTSVGRTPAGTPVRLHPAYLEADWRILLGEISWHYFAGFGGGRKLVFPGLAEPAGIAENHRRAILLPEDAASDPDGVGIERVRWQERCGPGRLAGNPVHEDLEAAVALAPPHWVLTAVDDPPPDPDPARPRRFGFRVHQGPYPAAFAEAAEAFERAHRVGFTVAPRVLLTDAGGRPRDATFLQAHKSLQHGARFVPRGGRMLLAAECADGLGSATLARFAADPERFRPLVGIREDPLSVIHLQTLTALLSAVRVVSVGLWSALPAAVVRALGMMPLASEEEARAWAVAGGPASWGWLPRAERFLPPAGFKGGALR
jgi:nickel-dependent lactate racemase